MIKLLLLSMMAFANQPEKFSEGYCEKSYSGAIVCEDDKDNVCVLVEYDNGEISFGCRKVKKEK